MASTYKTPGVYVEEISTLPASVAQVETAIPAFIGYTEKADENGENLKLKPTRIGSLLEYKELFGGSQNVTYQATVELDGDVKVDTVKPLSYLLFHQLEMFFRNGGGDCYIISVGSYNSDGSLSVEDFTLGLGALKKEDEPTIILLTDAVHLSTVEYYDLAKSALQQCADLQDRFAVLDVHNVPVDNDGVILPNGDTIDTFRNRVGNNDLKYGAGYYPNLKTVLKKRYNESQLTVEGVGDAAITDYQYVVPDTIGVTYTPPLLPAPPPGSSAVEPPKPKIKIEKGDGTTPVSFEIKDETLIIKNIGSGKTGNVVFTEWEKLSPSDRGDFEITNPQNNAVGLLTKLDATLVTSDVTLLSLKSSQTSLYNKIKKELDKDRVILPPSGAMAGVYASVDSDRGVWKAPANVSLSSVIKPMEKIDDKDQESLNVDVNGGKSINAIRAFAGKGTLVWGARTLAGNDNEWRYVPVRRFFNMVEESVKKSTHWAVFEPNDANTWIKVKAMIENFLTGLWRDGAMAGATPEEAFFVNVGLGTTMTAQDILEGYLIVEIGIAAVRPAEFIVLRFSHKLQES